VTVASINEIISQGVQGALPEVCLHFCWQQDVETHLHYNKNWKIYAKLVVGTKNYKHNIHEIIKMETSQENGEKYKNHEEM
jgi:hypothetical protein